jgi:hypothetical protein
LECIKGARADHFPPLVNFNQVTKPGHDVTCELSNFLAANGAVRKITMEAETDMNRFARAGISVLSAIPCERGDLARAKRIP